MTNSTSLTRDQFREVFNFDDASLDILFEAFDADKSNTLEISEMISGMSFLARGTKAEKINFLFKQYDDDNSGYLDQAEVLLMFKNLTSQLTRLEHARKPDRVKTGKTEEVLEKLNTAKKLSPAGSAQDLNAGGRGGGEEATGAAAAFLGEVEEPETKEKRMRVERMESHALDLASSFNLAGDLDGDGKISFEEFEEYMMKDPVCVKFLEVLTETTEALRAAFANAK